MPRCQEILNKVKQLLANGSSVNDRDCDGETPLLGAVSAGRIEVANFLLSKGADPHAETYRHETILHLAAASGDFAMIKLALLHGGNTRAVDDRGNTPLLMALGEVEYLAVDDIPGVDVTPEFDASIRKQISVYCSIAKLLPAKEQAALKKIIVTELAKDTVADNVRLLVEHSAVVNVANHHGITPLLAAARDGNTDVARYLLAKAPIRRLRMTRSGLSCISRRKVMTPRWSKWRWIVVAIRTRWIFMEMLPSILR